MNMEILWSTWRSKYIDAFKDEEQNLNPDCFFCNAINQPGKDHELLVVSRRKLCIVMLNKFPYNNGHFLIAPLRHIGDFEFLTENEMLEIMMTLNQSILVLKNVCKPHGFNIGANLGREAGAGVPGHLHFHIVPRWNGDTSYMPVISDVKVVSHDLLESQIVFSEAFTRMFPLQG